MKTSKIIEILLQDIQQSGDRDYGSEIMIHIHENDVWKSANERFVVNILNNLKYKTTTVDVPSTQQS